MTTGTAAGLIARLVLAVGEVDVPMEAGPCRIRGDLFGAQSRLEDDEAMQQGFTPRRCRLGYAAASQWQVSYVARCLDSPADRRFTPRFTILCPQKPCCRRPLPSYRFERERPKGRNSQRGVREDAIFGALVGIVGLMPCFGCP